MKRLFLTLAILLWSSVAWSAHLACDLPPSGFTITQTVVEITTNPGPSQTVQEVNGLATIQGSNFLLLDLDPLASGKYSFRAKWAEAGGWFSEYSDPFVLGKPSVPTPLRVVP